MNKQYKEASLDYCKMTPIDIDAVKHHYHKLSGYAIVHSPFSMSSVIR